MRDFLQRILGREPEAPDLSNLSEELRNDPRWRRMYERKWKCPCCGGKFFGLPDLALDQPQYWQDEAPPVRNPKELPTGDFLSRDFCVVDGDSYFVRCVLQIPIIGGGGADFGFGVWSSLSADNFKIYWDGFSNEDYKDPGPWFGWFSSNVKGYPDALSLKCQVDPMQNGQRPLIELEECEHPLSIEYHNGMTFDRALELHAINGHDLKSALTD
jgi:hypothetical protein